MIIISKYTDITAGHVTLEENDNLIKMITTIKNGDRFSHLPFRVELELNERNSLIID